MYLSLSLYINIYVYIYAHKYDTTLSISRDQTSAFDPTLNTKDPK